MKVFSFVGLHKPLRCFIRKGERINFTRRQLDNNILKLASTQAAIHHR